MRFVLILTAALTVCAQADPQFNKFNSGRWASLDFLLQDQSRTDNNNRDQNQGHHAFPSQSTFTGRRYPNDHGQEVNQDYGGSSGQCWDPIYHIYRDMSTSRPPSQYPSEYYNDNYRTQTDYYPHRYPEDRWHGPQAPHGPPPPPPHHHGHGPPPHHHGHRPPPHHHEHGPPPHHHEHGPPPHHYEHGPPPHHHGYGPPPHHHGHAPPPHHHGHGPPPHHHGQEPLALPPRPPHRPHNELNPHYELELCEDNSREKDVSDKLESSTSGDSFDVVIISTSPVPSTSEKPKDAEKIVEPVTQSTTDSSVKVTTEFDWNNYYVDGASVDNTGGAGVIDVRSGGLPAV